MAFVVAPQEGSWEEISSNHEHLNFHLKTYIRKLDSKPTSFYVIDRRTPKWDNECWLWH